MLTFLVWSSCSQFCNFYVDSNIEIKDLNHAQKLKKRKMLILMMKCDESWLWF